MQIYIRKLKLRQSTGSKEDSAGRETSIPAEFGLNIGDYLTQYYCRDFVLIVPESVKVNEEVLCLAIGARK